MQTTRFIEHQGRRIVLMDFSGVEDTETALQCILEARGFVAAQPKVKNLLTLVLVTGSRFDSAVVDGLRRLAEHDKPWVIAGAVVGMSALHRVIYRLVNTFTGRKLAAFDTLDEAKAWLVQQQAPLDSEGPQPHQ